MLDELDHVVLEADGPARAIELLREHGCGIDLLITDLILPGTSGRELARTAQQRCPRMKVLYMSGHEAHADPDMEFIEKPFRSEDLLAKVRAMLGERVDGS